MILKFTQLFFILCDSACYGFDLMLQGFTVLNCHDVAEPDDFYPFMVSEIDDGFMVHFARFSRMGSAVILRIYWSCKINSCSNGPRMNSYLIREV